LDALLSISIGRIVQFVLEHLICHFCVGSMVNCVAVFVLGYLSLAWISIWFIWCVWVFLFSESISFVKSCYSKNCQQILVVLFLIYLFLVLIWVVNLNSVLIWSFGAFFFLVWVHICVLDLHKFHHINSIVFLKYIFLFWF